jgi:hypothetical protein
LFEDAQRTERRIREMIIQHEKTINPAFDEFSVSLELDNTLPSQISEIRRTPPKHYEVFFKVGRTTGWTAGFSNSCRSVYYRVGERVNSVDEKDEHKHDNYGACLMWCFFGVKPGTPFSQAGDSGSLVFDRFGKAIGLLFGGQDERIVNLVIVPDISSVVSLDAVQEDIGRQLELSEIKFANGTKVF